jgi:hypothetical protein
MSGLYETAQVGKREDLADYIANVDVKNTPFTSRVKRGKKLTNKIATWQVDAYPAVRRTGVVDGADATVFENMASRAILTGVAQKIWRTPFVSDFAENVSDVAGIGQKREMAEQVRKALVMIKRDWEAICCASDHECQVDDGNDANQTRSLGKWIQATAQAVYPVPTAFLTPAASIDTTGNSTVTEEIFKTVTKSIYLQTGGKMDLAGFVGATLKGKISSFGTYESGVQYDKRRIAVEDQTVLKQMVDVIDNDFATVTVELSNFVGSDTAYGALRGFLIDMEGVEVRYNRMPRVKPLEDKGGGPRCIVDQIAMLVLKNPLGHGKFAGTS